jgi:hypothetical protein
VAQLSNLTEEEVLVSHEALMSSEDISLALDLGEDRETTPGEEEVVEELIAEQGG